MFRGNSPLDATQTSNKEMKMKLYYLYILMIATTIVVLPACDQPQTGSEKITDNVDDALDRRSGEKVRDAAEDASDKLEDVGKAIKESVKDATN